MIPSVSVSCIVIVQGTATSANREVFPARASRRLGLQLNDFFILAVSYSSINMPLTNHPYPVLFAEAACPVTPESTKRELDYLVELCSRASLLHEYWFDEERSMIGLRTCEEVREMDHPLAIMYLSLLIRSYRRKRVF